MRKAKRFIALLVVVMFVLSFAAPAGAATFSDVKGTGSDEVYRLNALGIVSGYPDGTYKPDGTITRAEFAVIAMSAAGLKSNADILKNSPSKFSDVKVGDWYTGWVNLAVSQGYMAGYPDGTFKPNANITYAECITVQVRLLGYNEKLPGEWPTEYLVKASEVGITDGVTFDATAPATRGNIAILTSQTLDQDMVVYSKDTDDWEYKMDSDDKRITLLSDKFDGGIYDEEDYLVTDWTVDSDGQYEITIDGEDNPFTTADETSFSKTMTLAKSAVVEGGMVVPFLNTHLINFIYNSDDEEITYVSVVSTKIKTGDVDEDGLTKLEVNGTSYKYADGFSYTYVAPADGVNDDYYTIYLDADNKIYSVSKKTPATDLVPAAQMVDELKTDKTLEYMKTGSDDLDVDDVVVVKDGAYATVNDLKSTDIVYVTADDFGLDFYVEAYSMTASGTLEAGYDTRGDGVLDQVKIAGKKYDLNEELIVSSDDADTWSSLSGDETFFDDFYGQNVKFGLDKKGDVAFIMTATKADSASIYGIVDDADTNNRGVVQSVTMMTSEGKTITYDVNTDEIEMEFLADYANAWSYDDVADETIDLDFFVKISLDTTGKISDLSLLEGDDLSSLDDASKDLQKIRVDGAWKYTSADTKVIDAKLEGEDADTVSISDLLDSVDTTAISGAYVKLDGSNVKFIFINDGALDVSADDRAMIIDKFFGDDGKKSVTVDIRGIVSDKELDNTADYSDIGYDVLYSYSMSSAKIDIDITNELDITVDGDVYGPVTDVDETHKSFEINADSDDSDLIQNYSLDADSYVYDMTGSDPVYANDISKISDGDFVFVLETDGTDEDRVGIADVVLIVDDSDYDECDWDNGGIPE